jgi:hypothetical protein
MQAKPIVPNAELPFFYDHLLDGTVRKGDKAGILAGLDHKIAAAKEFLSYLERLDNQNRGAPPVKSERYPEIQNQLTAPIVDGKIFVKINQDYNHATYEVADTRAEKKRLEDEIVKATSKAEDDKKKFHDSVKQLETKSQKFNTTTIGNLNITDPPLLFHFERVCLWILDVFYDSPPSRFEWDNFRKEVFLEDKGEDFKKRIRGLYIPKLYDSQIETCNYISSTRPMFKLHTKDENLDTLLSIAEDIVRSYNARFDYTTCKKTIQNNKIKIIENRLDLEQSEKVSKSTEPYINLIYTKLIEKELMIRAINLSDFQMANQNQHLFFKGNQGKVSPFLRAEALATWGVVTEDPKKAGAKKDEKKPEAKHGEEAKPISKPVDSKPVIANMQSPNQASATAFTGKPVGNAKVEFDTSFEMGKVD